MTPSLNTHYLVLAGLFIGLTATLALDVALSPPDLADNPNPGEDHPFIEERGSLRAIRGNYVGWPLADPPIGDRRYAVSGLPPGLAMEPSSGDISGIPKLAGRSSIVIESRRDHPTDPVAFMRFELEVGHPDAEPDHLPANPDIATEVLRMPVQPAPAGFLPPFLSFDGKSVNFLDPLPEGVTWDTIARTLSGLPKDSGVSLHRYEYLEEDNLKNGLLVLSADDHAAARPLEHGAIQLAIQGDTLVRSSGPIIYRTDLSALPPDRPAPSTESPSPWVSLFGSTVHSIQSGLGLFVARGNSQRVLLSDDGRGWREASLEHGIGRVFVSQASLLASSLDWSAVTYDGVTWNAIDPEQLPGVVAACHTGEEWLAVTEHSEVKTSRDGETWTDLGQMAWTGSKWDMQMAWHGGNYYLVAPEYNAAFGESEEPNVFISEDGVHWRLLGDLPVHALRLVSGGDDNLWLMTRNALYELPGDGESFDLRWMSPHGVRLVDLAAGTGGRVALSSTLQSWYINANELPPQLQGPETFPSLDRAAVGVEEPFSIQVRSDEPGVRFKAYHLPQGVELDPLTGILSGRLSSGGVYSAVLSVENERGEGIPRLVRLIASESGMDGSLKIEVRHVDGAQPARFFSYFNGAAIHPIAVETPNRSRDGLVASARELPPGLHFNQQTWRITGRTERAGRFSLIVDVSSPKGLHSIELPFLVYDWELGRVDSLARSELITGEDVEIQYRVQDAKDTFSFFAFALPDGLSLNPSTGTLTGRITTPGTYHYLIGIKTDAGMFGQPQTGQFFVSGHSLGGWSWPSVPERKRDYHYFTDNPNATAVLLSFPEEVTVEFLATPDGITFVPPRTLILDEGLGDGIHTARVRLSTVSGFAEKDLDLIFYQPEMLRHGIELTANFGSAEFAIVGVPYHVQLNGVSDTERIRVTGLPDGLTFNEAARTISGTIAETGEWTIHVMTITEGTATAYLQATLRAAIRPTATGSNYSVAYSNRRWEWLMPGLYQFPFVSSLLAPAVLPEGVTWEYGVLLGTLTTPGRFELPMRSVNSIIDARPPLIVHVYAPPVWDPETRRARHLPAPNLVDVANVAVPERFTPFSPKARLLASADGVSWQASNTPADVDEVTYTDIAVGTDFVVTGDTWWSVSRNLREFSSAQSSNPLHAVAAQGDLVVGAGYDGLVSLGGNGPVFHGAENSELHGVAIGNGRVVGVGTEGRVTVFRENGEHLGGRRHTNANLKEVLFSEGEFIAVGDQGTVMRSADGLNWIFDRETTILGADFRFVTANKEWIVAVAPWVTMGKRRDGGGWEPLERVPVEGSYLDRLTKADGTIIGGFAEGLYVPRRAQASVTILSAPCQQAMSGEPFVYDIGALAAKEVTYRAEGLPEGLRLDSGGRISGQMAEAGYYEMLVEASSAGRTHGKMVAIDARSGKARFKETFFEVPVSTPRVVVPTTVPFETYEISGTFRASSDDRQFHPGTEQWKALRLDVGFHEIRDYVFSVLLTNAAGTTRQTLTVRVVEPRPFFLAQPPDLTTAAEGSSVHLSAEVQGQWPITMQWYLNGDPIPRATGPVLTITSLSDATAGTYELRAFNALGEAVSTPAQVHLTASHESTFAGWAAERGLPADSHFQDHNGDGRPNILEYTLGAPGPGEEPRVVPESDGTWVYRFTQYRDRSDVALSLQHSDDLRTWEALPEQTRTIEPAGNDLDVVYWRLPSRRGGFLRLIATRL